MRADQRRAAKSGAVRSASKSTNDSLAQITPIGRPAPALAMENASG